MKQFFFFLFGFVCLIGSAQSGTEVYSAQLITTPVGYQIGTISNCSNNTGYDNQPSFWSEDTLLYAATRNGQTDVVLYQLTSGKKTGSQPPGKGANIPLCVFPRPRNLAPFVSIPPDYNACIAMTVMVKVNCCIPT